MLKLCIPNEWKFYMQFKYINFTFRPKYFLSVWISWDNKSKSSVDWGSAYTQYGVWSQTHCMVFGLNSRPLWLTVHLKDHNMPLSFTKPNHQTHDWNRAGWLGFSCSADQKSWTNRPNILRLWHLSSWGRENQLGSKCKQTWQSTAKQQLHASTKLSCSSKSQGILLTFDFSIAKNTIVVPLYSKWP